MYIYMRVHLYYILCSGWWWWGGVPLKDTCILYNLTIIHITHTHIMYTIVVCIIIYIYIYTGNIYSAPPLGGYVYMCIPMM